MNEKSKRGAILMFTILAILAITLVSLVSAVDTTKTETNSILYNTRTQKAIGKQTTIERQYTGQNKETQLKLPQKQEKTDIETLWLTVIFPPTCDSWPTCHSTCGNTCADTCDSTCNPPQTCRTFCPCTAGTFCPTCQTTCEGNTCTGPTCAPTCTDNTCGTWC